MKFKLLLILLFLISFSSNSFSESGKFETVKIIDVVGIESSKSFVSRCLDISAPPWVVFVATQEEANVKVQRFLDKNCLFPSGVAGEKKIPLVLKKDVLCPANSYCGDLGGEMPTFSVKLIVNNSSGSLNRILVAILIHDPEKIKKVNQPVSSEFIHVGPGE